MAMQIGRGLIVSCQAEEGSPFNEPVFIAAFARAAELGGAVGVRICGVENVATVRRAVRLPIIGITKSVYPDGSILITPGQDDVEALQAAGADVVAMDATARRRSTGWTGTETLGGAARAVSIPLMADVSTLEEARRFVTLLKGRVGLFKVGLELYTAFGKEAVQAVQAEGGRVILDLKFHDIPNTSFGVSCSARRG